MNQPVRTYPLRIVHEPPVYVAGEKTGQKVYPPGSGPMHNVPPPGPPTQQLGMPMNFGQQQAMVAQQNTNMELLERRREQERARVRNGNTGGVSSKIYCHNCCVDSSPTSVHLAPKMTIRVVCLFPYFRFFGSLLHHQCR
jgi:hypothetical protein